MPWTGSQSDTLKPQVTRASQGSLDASFTISGVSYESLEKYGFAAGNGKRPNMLRS